MTYTNPVSLTGDNDVPSYEKNISICLRADGFSFAVTTVRDELLQHGEVSLQGVAGMSDTLAAVRTTWEQCRISPIGLHAMEMVMPSEHFVLVPDDLYAPGNDRRYLEPLLPIPLGLGIFSCHNDTVAAQAVFTGDTNRVSAFKIAMPGIQVKCQFNKLVNAEVQRLSAHRAVMLLHLRQEAMDVVVFVKRRLQLVNTFPVASVADAVYHAVDVMKALRMEESEPLALLCGDVDRDRYAAMAPYFPQADLYGGRPLATTVETLRSLPTYRHALLFS